jgi:hypothetical protein
MCSSISLTLPRTPDLIGDAENRCFIILAGRPTGSHWKQDMIEAACVLTQAHIDGVFGHNDLKHCRGNFLAFASGVSFGGGQRVCNNAGQTCNSILTSLGIISLEAGESAANRCKNADHQLPAQGQIHTMYRRLPEP